MLNFLSIGFIGVGGYAITNNLTSNQMEKAMPINDVYVVFIATVCLIIGLYILWIHWDIDNPPTRNKSLVSAGVLFFISFLLFMWDIVLL